MQGYDVVTLDDEELGTVVRESRDLLDRPEPASRQRGEEGVAARPLVVPRERDHPHEVRARLLEPGLVAERGGQPADTALAANATHLQGLGLNRHLAELSVRWTRSAQTAPSPRPAADLELPLGLWALLGDP